jgi:hypothetical protein
VRRSKEVINMKYIRRSKRKRYIRKSKPSVILKEKRESYYLLTGMWQHYLHIVGF